MGYCSKILGSIWLVAICTVTPASAMDNGNTESISGEQGSVHFGKPEVDKIAVIPENAVYIETPNTFGPNQPEWQHDNFKTSISFLNRYLMIRYRSYNAYFSTVALHQRRLSLLYPFHTFL